MFTHRNVFDLRPSNKTRLTNIANDLVRLHRQGIITSEDLDLLFRVITSNYVEAEVSLKVDQIFNRKIAPLLALSYVG